MRKGSPYQAWLPLARAGGRNRTELPQVIKSRPKKVRRYDPRRERKRLYSDIVSNPLFYTLNPWEWAAIERVVPQERKTTKSKRALAVIINLLRHKLPWRSLDLDGGCRWTSYYNRYRKWSEEEWWDDMLTALSISGYVTEDLEEFDVDWW